eukprot:6838717-Pyramimonas_sp.AAC.1
MVSATVSASRVLALDLERHVRAVASKTNTNTRVRSLLVTHRSLSVTCRCGARSPRRSSAWRGPSRRPSLFTFGHTSATFGHISVTFGHAQVRYAEPETLKYLARAFPSAKFVVNLRQNLPEKELKWMQRDTDYVASAGQVTGPLLSHSTTGAFN